MWIDSRVSESVARHIANSLPSNISPYSLDTTYMYLFLNDEMIHTSKFCFLIRFKCKNYVGSNRELRALQYFA